MDKFITGTLIWYYFICKREVWLMSRQINPFQDNPFLDIGRYIQNTSYQREKKSIRIQNIEIDLIQKIDGKYVIAEVKKSSKFLESAKMQLVFYLSLLKRYGINTEGELLFPEERKRVKVMLDRKIQQKLDNAIKDIRHIISQNTPPPPIRVVWCKNCAYKDFCFA